MEKSSARAAARSGVRCLLALAAMATTGAMAATPGGERDICEQKTGAELIRCIEAAARSPASSAQAAPAAARKATRAAPESGTPAPPPARAATPSDPTAMHGRSPEDCSGRSGDALRRCLAAGGRLASDPAGAASAASARAVHDERCAGKSAEARRECVDVPPKSTAAARAASSPSRVIPCTGYTAADQPLCVHRNSAIVECRERSRYPDFEVCLRSHMTNAPEPVRADCSKVHVSVRGHCEARNRVFSRCTADRMGYFACLERQLGPDAVLTSR